MDRGFLRRRVRRGTKSASPRGQAPDGVSVTLGGHVAHPTYRQIAEDLRAQIESGQLEPGQQLRSELELRDHYQASRNTIRDAIKWLMNLGLVETRPGQELSSSRIDPFVTNIGL